MFRAWIALLMTAPVVGGCGAGSASSNDGGMFVNCATDTRATPYVPGTLALSSQTSPVFVVKLMTSDPGPPIKGDNTWTIEVDEASTGMPLDGLDISVLPWMPDHMHGTSKLVVVTPSGTPGLYTLAPVYLRMSGFWQVKVTVVSTTVGGGTTELSLLTACIP